MRANKIIVTIMLLLALLITAKAALGDASNDLVITGISVNDAVLEEGDATEAVLPGDQLTIDVEVTNNLEHPVTGITVTLPLPDDESVQSEEPINLEAGESATITLEGDVSYALTEGEYDLLLHASGTDFEDNTIAVQDQFEFTLVVEQEPADVVINELSFSHEGSLLCEAQTTLTVELLNTGKNTENDIVITITGPNGEILEEEWSENVDPNSFSTEAFVISTQDLDLGENEIEVLISYRDDFAQDEATTTLTKESCIESVSPQDSSISLVIGAEQEFSVELTEDVNENDVAWTVSANGEKLADETGLEVGFVFEEAGEYIVNVIVNENEDESFSWTVEVTDKPSDLADFGVNSDDISDASAVSDLVLEQNNGQIAFDETVDISQLTSLADVVEITKVAADHRIVGIESTSPLNVAATITLENFPKGDTVIYKADGFGDDIDESDTQVCSATECIVIENDEGDLVFEVDGFSTYIIVNEKAADLTVSAIEFTNVNLGESVQKTFTLKNTGTTKEITDISLDITGLESAYSASLSTTSVSSLEAGESVEITLTVEVPSNEDFGQQDIGDIVITWEAASEDGTQTTTVPVLVTPKSFLIITDIDTNGDFELNEENEIEVTVENEYSEEIENVKVKIELDWDDDDWDDKGDLSDLDPGDDDKITFKFDPTGKEFEDNEITITVTVTGKAKDDDTKHETVSIQTVTLDVEGHDVVVDSASLSHSSISCSAETTLSVDVQNLGDDDEDDVVVRVSNSDLGIDLKKDLNLEGFFEKDFEDSVTFFLKVEDAAPGEYPLLIEVFRDDDKKEDDKTITLTIKGCDAGASGTTTLVEQTLTAQLEKQLELEGLVDSTAQSEATSAATSSFRQSNSYVALLGVMALLVLVTVLLAVGVVVSGKLRGKVRKE